MIFHYAIAEVTQQNDFAEWFCGKRDCLRLNIMSFIYITYSGKSIKKIDFVNDIWWNFRYLIFVFLNDNTVHCVQQGCTIWFAGCQISNYNTLKFYRLVRVFVTQNLSAGHRILQVVAKLKMACRNCCRLLVAHPFCTVFTRCYIELLLVQIISRFGSWLRGSEC